MDSMVSFMMFPKGEQIDTMVLQEKMKAIQKEQEEKLAQILKHHLNWYINGDKGLYNKINLRFNGSTVQLMESICFRQVAKEIILFCLSEFAMEGKLILLLSNC